MLLDLRFFPKKNNHKNAKKNKKLICSSAFIHYSYIPDHFNDCLLVGLDFGLHLQEKIKSIPFAFFFFICVRVRVARITK